ncbi:hypothetical protein, partial [Bradyrhizobium sp.]|uniref:hypothetical protein n=1 Tax=Bradyrhizobium sp. TaxID=376 RepID=UPI003BB150EB
MNPNFGSMVAVFSAPRSSIRPVTARFGGAERRSQHMHIKYMFIVQRYGLMPALAAGFAPRLRSLIGHRVGQRSGKWGRQSPRPIRSSRT